MLTIRLQRVGKKNQAAFRIVIAEKQRSAKKQFHELLGHYNPRTKAFGIKDQARLDYWVGQHVEFSPTMHNLLVTKGILKGEKVKAWRPKVVAKETATTPVKTGVQSPSPESSPQPSPEATAGAAAGEEEKKQEASAKEESKPTEAAATSPTPSS